MRQRLMMVMLFAVLSLPGTVFSEIIYVDLGGITTHSSKYFDLDNNGVHDLGVVWSYDDWADDTSAQASLPFGAPADNGFAASGSLALKLDSGDTIGAGREFKGDTVMLSRYWDDYDWDYFTWGNWDSMVDGETGYLGFRFQGEDDAFHYGWIQAYVNPGNQYITLYDLAWETNGNLAIAAGDTGSPVPVPSAVWLLASGLIGFAGVNRKRRINS